MRALAFLVVALPATCYADWTATILHPPTAIQSVGSGSGPGVQTGDYTAPGSGEHAALWTGTPGSLVDLHPAGAGSSHADAAAGSQQAGFVTFGFTDHAAIWSGTAASFVDLNPIGVSESQVNATDGANQAGDIDVGVGHAAYWSGTAASYVDINPPVADASTASAVRGVDVAGYAFIGSEAHAAYWVKVGPLFLFTDLHPAGAGASFANAVAPGVQGGHANFASSPSSPHAALWSGTAASVIDLNPAGAGSSRILGMDTGVQAGLAFIGGSDHAGVWFGTAASFVDLQAYLPAGYFNSQGRAVYTDGAGFIQVVGYASHLTDTGTRIEAIVWTIPEPASAAIWVLAAPAIAGRRRRR